MMIKTARRRQNCVLRKIYRRLPFMSSTFFISIHESRTKKAAPNTNIQRRLFVLLLAIVVAFFLLMFREVIYMMIKRAEHHKRSDCDRSSFYEQKLRVMIFLIQLKKRQLKVQKQHKLWRDPG